MNNLDKILTDINARKERLADTAEVCKLTSSAVHYADTDKDQLGEDIAWMLAEIDRLDNLCSDYASAAQRQSDRGDSDTALISWFELNCSDFKFTVNSPWGAYECSAKTPQFRAMVSAAMRDEVRLWERHPSGPRKVSGMANDKFRNAGGQSPAS